MYFFKKHGIQMPLFRHLCAFCITQELLTILFLRFTYYIFLYNKFRVVASILIMHRHFVISEHLDAGHMRSFHKRINSV